MDALVQALLASSPAILRAMAERRRKEQMSPLERAIAQIKEEPGAEIGRANTVYWQYLYGPSNREERTLWEADKDLWLQQRLAAMYPSEAAYIVARIEETQPKREAARETLKQTAGAYLEALRPIMEPKAKAALEKSLTPIPVTREPILSFQPPESYRRYKGGTWLPVYTSPEEEAKFKRRMEESIKAPSGIPSPTAEPLARVESPLAEEKPWAPPLEKWTELPEEKWAEEKESYLYAELPEDYTPTQTARKEFINMRGLPSRNAMEIYFRWIKDTLKPEDRVWLYRQMIEELAPLKPGETDKDIDAVLMTMGYEPGEVKGVLKEIQPQISREDAADVIMKLLSTGEVEIGEGWLWGIGGDSEALRKYKQQAKVL